MSPFDLVVRNADIATAGDRFHADIGVRQGRIAALAETLQADGAEEIDAAERIVTPGGVDGHIHLDQPAFGGVKSADDFASGTASAACGGTTTILPFALQQQDMSLRESVEDYHARADGKAHIDYGFHLILTNPNAQVLGQELPALVREGYTSFKVYMTYEGLRLDDRQILDVLALARREGAMTMIHAENADCIDWLIDRLQQAGKTAPIHHARSRPPLVEREAAHRAITLSELAGAPILLVHVSGAETIEQIRWARAKGLTVHAETCPQYLFLTEKNLARPGFEGAKYLCSPPPRDAHHQAAVWQGIEDGLFEIISSDHAPYRFEGKDGKQAHGTAAPFTHVPNGVPGVETRLPLLFSEGVMAGRISLERFVALTAANTAKLYGLYPRKGTIAVGADADLVIWDAERRVRLTNEMLHSDCDYTPYEGMELTGWPAMTLCRGRVVAQDGELLAEPGQGQFLPCAPPVEGPRAPQRLGW